MKFTRLIKSRLILKLPFFISRHIFRNYLVSLCYHIVSDDEILHVKNLFSFKTPEMFEADLKYLQENFNVISYEELVDCLEKKNELKPRSILITFDDGYKECFSVVRPLLLKYNLPCIFFIPTNFIDNKKLFYRNKISLLIEHINSLSKNQMKKFNSELSNTICSNFYDKYSLINWIKSLKFSDEEVIDTLAKTLEINWEKILLEFRPYLTSNELRKLAHDGFTIGAHSQNHTFLSDLSLSAAEAEIINSCNTICELVGQQVTPFAFPFTAKDFDLNSLKPIQEKNEFVGLFFDYKGTHKNNFHLLNRIPADTQNGSKSHESNIPYLLRREYKRLFLLD